MECSNCKKIFPSRNKLFKHLNQCNDGKEIESILPKQNNEVSQELTFSAIVPSLEESNIRSVLFVTGGRIRGRTLSCTERYDYTRNCWIQCPNMLEARGSHGASALGEKIFIIGGGGLHSNLASCEVFHNALWATIAPCQTLRHALAVIDVDGKIYSIGGWIDGSRCSSVVECYDPQLNSWVYLAPLQIARRLMGACAFHDRIFVFGGNCDDPQWFTCKSEVYDIASNIWTFIEDLPASGETSAEVVNGIIYVIIHGKGIYQYDPVLNNYTFLSRLPLSEWYCFGTAVINNCIIIYGGAVTGKWSKLVFLYHCATNIWCELAPMLHCRRRCAGAVMELSSASI